MIRIEFLKALVVQTPPDPVDPTNPCPSGEYVISTDRIYFVSPKYIYSPQEVLLVNPVQISSGSLV